MNFNNKNRLNLLAALTVLMAAILACSLPGAATPASPATPPPVITVISVPTDTPTVEAGSAPATAIPVSTETPTSTPIQHVSTPGEPFSTSLSQITDSNSSALAPAHRANGGDNYNANLYERPFTSTSMDYRPDLDITLTNLSRDAAWVYVTVSLAGQAPSGGLTGDYGLEVDLNLDGRGDLLVMAAKPGPDWSTDGVRVWKDSNSDVGSFHPLRADPPGSTDGYDSIVFDQGVGPDPDAAWARISPVSPTAVQVAFKSALINDSGKFLWGAWTLDDSMLNPDWFDFNDHFSLAEAGSPLIEDSSNYPLRVLAQVDNTCRWAVGFKPAGTEPGVCPVAATPTPTPTITPTPSPTLMKPGSITGTIYDNGINGGLKYDSKVSKPASGISVMANAGDCSSPGALLITYLTDATGAYAFYLNPGTYCISFAAPTSRATAPKTINVTNGGAVNNVNFFYYTFLG